MSDRFDKFTERARKVLVLAQEEAQRFNHNYIGTEHLLLGPRPRGRGRRRQGPRQPRRRAEQGALRRGVHHRPRRPHGDRATSGLTPRAKKVIELAVDEARRLNHHYIGTEHLLLGLVREGEGIAAGVLESLGVSLEKVRSQVIHVSQPVRPPAPARAGAARQSRRPPPSTSWAWTSPPPRAPASSTRSSGAQNEIERVDPDPLPAHQEQPRPDRRAGRRQDGHRRGPGPAHRLPATCRRRCRASAC